MKRADIPDILVLQYAREGHSRINARTPVGYRLADEGYPSKLVTAKIEHMVTRGLLDYGVSPWTAWPTAKGHEMLKEHSQT